MKESHGVWIGSLNTERIASIPDAAAVIPSLIGNFDGVLITRIDSARDLNPPTISPEAWLGETRGLPVFSHGNALRTTGTALLEIAKHSELFTGFDEVWFFPSAP